MFSLPSFRPPEPQSAYFAPAVSHPPAFSSHNNATRQSATIAPHQDGDPFAGAGPIFDTAAIVTMPGPETRTAANAQHGAQHAHGQHGQRGHHTHHTHLGPHRPYAYHKAQKNTLAAIQNDEYMLSLRKRTVARFGALWLRPPGVPKTLQGMEDERAEREEAEGLRARELALEEEQRAMLAANARMEEEGEEQDEDQITEEGVDETADGLEMNAHAQGAFEGSADMEEAGETPGMRDLDEDVPDLDASGGFGDWSDDDEEEDSDEEDDGIGQEAPGGLVEPVNDISADNTGNWIEDGREAGEVAHDHALQEDMGEMGLEDDEVMVLATGSRRSLGVSRRGRTAMMQEMGLTATTGDASVEGDGDYSHQSLFSSPARRPNRMLNFQPRGSDVADALGRPNMRQTQSQSESLFTPLNRATRHQRQPDLSSSIHGPSRTPHARPSDISALDMSHNLDDDVADGSVEMADETESFSSSDDQPEPTSHIEDLHQVTQGGRRRMFDLEGAQSPSGPPSTRRQVVKPRDEGSAAGARHTTPSISNRRAWARTDEMPENIATSPPSSAIAGPSSQHMNVRSGNRSTRGARQAQLQGPTSAPSVSRPTASSARTGDRTATSLRAGARATRTGNRVTSASSAGSTSTAGSIRATRARTRQGGATAVDPGAPDTAARNARAATAGRPANTGRRTRSRTRRNAE